MTKTELDKMLEGARAANHGPWYLPKRLMARFLIKQDATHIASCSPEKIISLLNQLENLKRGLDALREVLNAAPQDCLGTADDGNKCYWPIRDEMIHNITGLLLEPTDD